MFNVTNDAWYGVSSAAIQHLSMYAARAAESGRAVARVANTGITAWVDTRGRMHGLTPVYEEALVVADIPLNDETTPFMALGEWVALPATLFTLFAWFYALLGARPWRRERHLVERAVGVFGVLVAFGSVAAYTTSDAYGDEAAATQALFGTIAGLLVGIGALSARPWGRKAQMWVGGVALVTCTLGAFIGDAYGALAIAAVGAAIGGLAYRRRDEYKREADADTAPATH
jgi:hypothetical protein